MALTKYIAENVKIPLNNKIAIALKKHGCHIE